MNEGSICAMYLKLIFLEGVARYNNLLKDNPPNYLLVFSRRIGCVKDGKFQAKDKYGDDYIGSAIAFGWFVWIKDSLKKPIPQIYWYDPKRV